MSLLKKLWVFDQLPVRIYFKDRTGQFIYANQVCVQELGMKSLSELRGKTDFDFFAPDLAQQWLAEELDLLRTGTPYLDRAECERWLDGHESFVLTSKMPFLDSQGKLLGILGMSKDITADHRRREWFQLAVNSAGDGLWYDDVRTGTRWYSSRWKEMLGFNETELPDNTFRWREYVIEEDRHVVDQTMASCSPHCTTFTYLCRMRHKSGRIIWVRCRGKGTFDRAGQPTAFAGSHTDVTSWRDQEDYYRLLLDTVPSFIFVKDQDYRFRYVNHAMAMAMRKSRESILDTRDEDHFDESLVSQFRRDDSLVLATGEPRKVECEVFSLARDHRDERFLATIKVPLWKNGKATGAPDGIVGVATDITDLRAAQDMLQVLLDNVAEGVFFKDIQGRFTRVSRALAEYVGAESPAAMIGCTDADFFHSTFVAEATVVDAQVLRNGKPSFNQRLKSVLRDESPEQVNRWRQVSKVPFHNSSGEVVGLVGISHDITQIESAREELQSKTELLTGILDAIPQKIFVKDRNYRYIMCNRAFASTHGLASPRDIEGSTDEDRWDARQAALIRAVDERVMNNNREELNYPEQLIDNRDKMRRLVTSKIPLHDTQGRVVGVLGIYDDITPEYELERRRTSTRQYLESLMLWEDDFRRLAFLFLLELTHRDGLGFNRALLFRYEPDFRRLVGVVGIGQPDRASAITVKNEGENFEDITIQQCLSDYDENEGPPDGDLNELIQDRKIELGDGDMLVRWIGETECEGSIVVGSVKTPGEMGAVGALLRQLDATEVAAAMLKLPNDERLVVCCDNVRSQQQFDSKILVALDDWTRGAFAAIAQSMARRRRQERVANERAWQDLAQRVAHALNNIVPFTESALLDAQRLVATEDPSSTQRIQDAIVDVRQCRQLVRDFKDFAAPLSLTLSPLSIATLRDHFVSWLVGRAEIMVVTEVLPLQVEVDVARLSIVYRELAQNADRAVRSIGRNPPEAHLSVRIRMATTDEHRRFNLSARSGWLAIDFQDDGPGIKEGDREKVFEPLVSLLPGGMGLGLAEVTKIIEGHKGVIRVAPNAPSGGAVIVTLIPFLGDAV